MRKLKLRDWPLPLITLAFVGLSITFLSPVFNTITRWIILGLVVVYLLFKAALWRPFRTHFGSFTFVFFIWAVVTVTWSEAPLLSSMKAGAFLVIAFTCMAAGQHWVYQHTPQEALNYLFPLTLVTLLAGIFGRFAENSVYSAGIVSMTQGLVSGSNMFGSLLAMCLPLLLWQSYRHWSSLRHRMLWLALTGVDLYYLIASASRSAMLSALCIALGLFLSLEGKRKVPLSLLAVGALLATFVVPTGTFQSIEEKYIYKGSKDEGLIASRVWVWEETYEGAQKAGLLGGGYGVSIGSGQFKFALTTQGYGREKGNSQLAIIEETGWIGLFIYFVSLLVLAGRVRFALLARPLGPERTLLALVAGTLLGMVVQSVFEAWWVAPASPESVYFWALAGVTLGLTDPRPRLALPASRRDALPAERFPFQTAGRHSASG